MLGGLLECRGKLFQRGLERIGTDHPDLGSGRRDIGGEHHCESDCCGSQLCFSHLGSSRLLWRASAPSATFLDRGRLARSCGIPRKSGRDARGPGAAGPATTCFTPYQPPITYQYFACDSVPVWTRPGGRGRMWEDIMFRRIYRVLAAVAIVAAA